MLLVPSKSGEQSIATFTKDTLSPKRYDIMQLVKALLLPGKGFLGMFFLLWIIFGGAHRDL